MNKIELELFMKKVDKKHLPKKWDDFVNKITREHNVIYKNKAVCICTNCNNKFDAGKIKIGDLAICPHCKNKYAVMGGYLYYRGQSFEKSVIVCQRINKKIVVRVIEIYTYFNRQKGKMITSTQEYARIIAGVGTFLSEATQFFMKNQYIYHNVKNSYWRKYEGCREYYSLMAFPYNKKQLIKGTNLEYAPIEEFLNNTYCYNYIKAVCLASYPHFEAMWKMGLKNLAKSAYKFKKTGNFQKVYGLSKSLLPFMIENNIDYREYQVLKLIKEPNLKALKEFKYVNLNKLRKLSKQVKITKHIETCAELCRCQKKDLDYVLKYTKLNKLVKYKEIIDKFYIYKDYLKFIEKLGFDMKDTKYLYPKNLVELHNKFEQELSIKENIEIITKIYERFLDLSNYIYEDDKYIIYPAPQFEAFEEESRMQHNCVRQYAESYANSETEIYFMRDKNNIEESLVTVEYRDGIIIQQQQKSHEKTTEEQAEFLNKWLKFRNKKRKIIFEKSERTLFVA